MRPIFVAAFLAMFAWPLPAVAAGEETVEVRITIKDHKFIPAEIEVPAGKPLKIIVKNEDPTAEEFESLALRKEKVVKGGGEIVLEVKALKPGRYKFFGEYHADTAVGYLVVK